MKFLWLLALGCCVTIQLHAQLTESIGKADLSDWQGGSYRYPDGRQYNHGFRNINEGVRDWSRFYGISFQVFADKPVNVEVVIKVPGYEKDNIYPEIAAAIPLAGTGWQRVVVPWRQFRISEAQRTKALQTVKELIIRAAGARVRDVQLTKGEVIALSTPVMGKSAQPGTTATYILSVGNTTQEKQSVSLQAAHYGWESMQTTLEPGMLELAPGETKTCTVKVKVTDRSPAGSREKQVISVLANGKALADAGIELITASALPYPNILHTAARWQQVKDKVTHYAWAKAEQDKYLQLADKWQVPEPATRIGTDNADKGLHLFNTQEEFNFMAAGIAYQLTGNKQYAEKVALFLRRLSDPENGYPKTLRACHQSFVQEGHFFQHIAMAYDMIVPSGVLSQKDVTDIENTFRLFIETVNLGARSGAINNWQLSEETGALYCALALQDWHLAESIFSGPCGITDHLSNGVMNDGWWYECSISYNVWCASEFSQIALALEPWGINFKDMRVPSGTTRYYSLMPDMMQPGLYGMNFNKWGPVTKNSTGIKDMWDALPSFTDYRGIMFAVNDAQENLVTGQPFELAYYLYQDPEYAAIIRRSNDRDLLYGVPELPQVSSVLTGRSAFADNMGIVMLRSNKTGRPQREQIQAALHYGTHGGYHGHFDRTNLLNLSRYGRSFYNPEMVWYGYGNFMYKFYVQTSMSKNMVVVDQKMQEPVESYRTLFYTGSKMQATVVETKARWSNPPYGGMQYEERGGISFAGKCWQEGRSVPIPAGAPAYGAVTGYTEPVFQRRLMIVTDDYVVLADYVKAQQEHTYDWLFNAKGFKGVTAGQKQFVRHTAQMNADPLGSAQFITDCNWWNVGGTAKAAFSTCWGKDCDNSGTRAPNSEDGVLQLDVYNAWPLQKEIMTATTPEDHGISNQVVYTIKGDGRPLKTDSTGAWILGTANIDLPLNNVKQLSLELRLGTASNSALFWGNATIVLQNGKEIPAGSLPLKYSNIQQPAVNNKDYLGGPVKLSGDSMLTALAATPADASQSATITIDLSSIKAVRLKVKLGSDYPFGDETPRRKTYAVRSKGRQAVYLSVIEPYESKAVIKSVQATAADKLRVELLDGRVQEFNISHLEQETEKVKVAMTEKNGAAIIKEETK